MAGISEFSKKNLESAKINHIPKYVVFEMTPLCNFRCKMCYIRLDKEVVDKSGKMMSKDQWINIAQEAANMGGLYAEVTGGEVFTRPDFKDIYIAMIKMGYLITLRTNGYLLDDEVQSWLSKYKPYRIFITLYGGSDETYEKVTGIKNGFSVVTRNIDKLLENKFNVGLTMTMINENKDDFNTVLKWTSSRGLKLKGYYGIFNPIGDAKQDSQKYAVQLSDEECEITDDMKFKDFTPIDIDRTSLFSRCKNFGAKYVISWDGKMLVCNVFTNEYEEINGRPLKECFDSLYKKLDKVKSPKECLDCKYYDFCYNCPAKMQSECGKEFKINENICRIARYNYRKALQIVDGEENENKR